MGLILRSSDIHAVGCYTTTSIPARTLVVEYTGERISPEQADDRYEHRDVTYLFGMEDGKTVIDGYGMAAFINHSCGPNCETDEIDGRVWIIAMRDIAPGEELTYDYNLYDGEEDDPAPCFCGAKNCRGSMYSPEELERQKQSQLQAASSKLQGVLSTA
ncbi:MAG TPA: SET domain-containing protein-lysine N-methyltransferase [Terriglobales bacterium]|nr:SET domain-containing protein-lysine N-methyltransferase [Terriglobales bacterium]